MTNKSWVRNGSLALAAVPALALGFLGSNLLAGFAVPTPQINETRQFNLSGQNLSSPPKMTSEDPAEVFLGQWRNTVRDPPTPRL